MTIYSIKDSKKIFLHITRETQEKAMEKVVIHVPMLLSYYNYNKQLREVFDNGKCKRK